MNKVMDQLQRNYNVEYYNFSNDSTFTLNNKYFYNSDHLNKEGAKNFSAKLLKEIK